MPAMTEFERQLEAAKAAVERRDAAVRLYKNRDFKKLILDYFMVEECARYARQSADPALPPENRADALNLAQAAGHLKRFLHVVTTMGDQAAREIDAIENYQAMDDEDAAANGEHAE